MKNEWYFAITFVTYLVFWYTGNTGKKIKLTPLQHTKRIALIALLCAPFNVNGHIVTVLGSGRSEKNMFSLFSIVQNAEKNAYSIVSIAQKAKGDAYSVVNIAQETKRNAYSIVAIAQLAKGKNIAGFAIFQGPPTDEPQLIAQQSTALVSLVQKAKKITRAAIVGFQYTNEDGFAVIAGFQGSREYSTSGLAVCQVGGMGAYGIVTGFQIGKKTGTALAVYQDADVRAVAGLSGYQRAGYGSATLAGIYQKVDKKGRFMPILSSMEKEYTQP